MITGAPTRTPSTGAPSPRTRCWSTRCWCTRRFLRTRCFEPLHPNHVLQPASQLGPGTTASIFLQVVLMDCSEATLCSACMPGGRDLHHVLRSTRGVTESFLREYMEKKNSKSIQSSRWRDAHRRHLDSSSRVGLGFAHERELPSLLPSVENHGEFSRSVFLEPTEKARPLTQGTQWIS